MKNLNIKSKLLFISIIPLLFVIILSCMVLYKLLNDKTNLDLTKYRIQEAEAISKVVHFLQIERGITVGVILRNDLNEKDEQLSAAEANSNIAIDNAKDLFLKVTKNKHSHIVDTLEDIKSRGSLNLLYMSVVDAKSYYSKNIFKLLSFIETIPTMMDDRENRNYIQAYTYLSAVKEGLGQTRAALMDVFTNNNFLDETFIALKEDLKVCELNNENFKLVAPKNILDFYSRVLKSEVVDETMKMIDTAIKNRLSSDFNIAPAYWFGKSTEFINLLKDVENELFAHVNKLINKKLKYVHYTIAFLLFFLLISVVVMAILITQIIKKILFSTDKLEREYDDSLLLLEQYKQAVDRSFIVSKTDSEGIITYVNDEFCKITGYSKYDLLGKSHNTIRHHDTPKELFQELWHTIKELKEPWFGEIQNRKKDETSYWVKAVINPIVNCDGEIIEYIGIKTDITEIKNALTRDFLTGYGSRFKLNGDIAKLKNLAVAIFNIDNFRQINDFYGHAFGDKVITSVANTIHKHISKYDNFRFYRLQGDEFALLAIGEDSKVFTQKISDILSYIKLHEIEIDEETLSITCSCGVSFENKQQILLSADMALKIAKKGNSDLLVYSEDISLNRQYENNLKCTKKLSYAIKNDNIVTYFQPIVNNTNKIYEKYECLVRMIDGDEVISPFFFLEIARQTRQYFDITKTVIAQSFEMFKDKEVEFSINLSIIDILEPQMLEYIFMMLKKYDIGDRVVFEILESEYIENFEGVIYFINEIKKYKCKVAIDDFGTGYSNFAYLIKLKADYLKIDGSLIKNLDRDKNSFLVVSTIIEFSKKLGMKTIAEFVENEEIFKIVKNLGVDYSQGYFFSAPKKDVFYEE